MPHTDTLTTSALRLCPCRGRTTCCVCFRERRLAGTSDTELTTRGTGDEAVSEVDGRVMLSWSSPVTCSVRCGSESAQA